MKLQATAHHEAGHAVVAFLLGFRVTSATIVPGSDYAGMVVYRPRGKVDLKSATAVMRIKAEDWIISILAGDIAQRRYDPRSSRHWHGTADRSHATDIALSLCGSGESATAYLAWLSIRTKDMVHGRWPIVEKIATLLLERKTISGDELRAAILPAPRQLTKSPHRGD